MKKVKHCTLAGCDGNAFALMGRWSGCARREGWTDAEIDAVLTKATSRDYQHLLAVLVAHCENPAGETNEED